MGLGEGIRKALGKITGKVIDEAAIKALVKDLQRALLMADVNVELVHQLSKRIEERALKEKPAAGISMNEHVMKVVYEELVGLMGAGKKLGLKKQKILFVGLYGSGKTTSIAKVASYFKKRGMKTALVGCDIHRPAAMDQVAQLAKQIDVPFYAPKEIKDPSTIAKRGIELFEKKYDILIFDSAGRDAFDRELANELKQMVSVIRPDERILVMSADVGQVARRQAEEFHKAVGLTGVIITKMDGSAKGGGALSATAASGTQISFIGVGEKIDDIEEFNPEKYVGRLLGVPDFEALIEKVRKVAPEMEVKEMPEEFNIRTFYEQLKAAKKMGPLKGVFQMMGMVDLPKEIMEEGEKKLDQYEAMINSMTKKEREDPELVRKSSGRIERIAKGCGVSPEEVRKFLSQFMKMKKLFKQLKGSKGMQKQLEKFLKKGGGKLG